MKRCLFSWAFSISLLVFAPSYIEAQLAITEVMSSAISRFGTNDIVARPDFWELTNFGTNTVDLTGFRFSDSAGLSIEDEGADEALFGGVSIAAGESIVFVRIENAAVVLNAAQFRAWWGDDKLPGNLQIYFYPGRGFNANGDSVQLWQIISGVSTTLVDRIELYEAFQGHTLTYDPLTGRRDVFSEAGMFRAFRAAETDDVGSPGTNAGPVAIQITQQPQNLTVDAGAPAVFSIQASGLPTPRYQWYFNGAILPGATTSTLTIAAAVPTNAGLYRVMVQNGVTNVFSVTATLLVNTIPSPPTLVAPLQNLMVTTGQTAMLRVAARGYPLPSFQWRFNGSNIAGATGPTHIIHNAQLNNSGSYSVLIQNPLGSTNASATLTVQIEPALFITEMFGSASTNSTIFGRGDWWELTNRDTNAVNLRGYRFDDRPRVLEGSVVITNDIILQPGESMLFIQDMTPEFFEEWWGEENLPESVQYFRYSGNGISGGGDSMALWNPTALDNDDYITRAEYLNLNSNFETNRGVSMNFWCVCDEFGLVSVLSEGGAITAARSADIGSPGYITNHPPRTVRPRFSKILRNENGAHLTWKTQVGKTYTLQRKDDLNASGWTFVSEHTATERQLTVTDPTATAATPRFYRLGVAVESQ